MQPAIQSPVSIREYDTKLDSKKRLTLRSTNVSVCNVFRCVIYIPLSSCMKTAHSSTLSFFLMHEKAPGNAFLLHLTESRIIFNIHQKSMFCGVEWNHSFRPNHLDQYLLSPS